MDNHSIAERFSRLAALMEIRGEDAFRIRSYQNAAEVIESWPKPLNQIAADEGEKGLRAIPGIGRAISGKVIELLEKGTFEGWEQLKAETPETVLDLLRVNGIGVKTAILLYERFKISSLDDLRRFVAGGGLETVDGVGEKTAKRISESLSRM